MEGGSKMSLETKIGVMLMTVAGLYLVVVSLVKGELPSPIPAAGFLLAGGCGIGFFYNGLKKPETKSP
jgi:drug/metabolite transporter (DMT)-like permease